MNNNDHINYDRVIHEMQATIEHHGQEIMTLTGELADAMKLRDDVLAMLDERVKWHEGRANGAFSTQAEFRLSEARIIRDLVKEKFSR